MMNKKTFTKVVAADLKDYASIMRSDLTSTLSRKIRLVFSSLPQTLRNRTVFSDEQADKQNSESDPER